jgi:acetyl esterase/lipase
MKLATVLTLTILLAAWPALGQVRKKVDRLGRGAAKAARAGDKALLRPRPKLILPEGARYVGDVEYAQFDDGGLFLDLYIQEKSPQPVPAVVWIHGDLWTGGDKLDIPSVVLLTQGFAMVSIDYRQLGEATFPAQLYDCKAAIRWLRAHAKEYNIDPDHLGVWGAGGGGHLAALLGTTGNVTELEGTVGGNLEYSSRVQAVCTYAAPTDLVKLGENHSSPKAPEALLLGKPVPANLKAAAAASPINYISKDDPPFLVMHGQSDDVVPIAQAETFAAALKSAGVSVEFVSLPTGHLPKGRQMMQAVQDFFVAHLHKPPAKP